MSKVLKDPSKAAHEIIEVLEDGDAIRNDGVRLTAANKNPWYVLATIYGEQEEGAFWWDYDQELEVKNRRAWNGFACANLSDQERKVRADKAGLPFQELGPLSEAEQAEILTLFQGRMGLEASIPASSENSIFSRAYFPNPFWFNKYICENTTAFVDVTFGSDAYFRSAVFNGRTSFSRAKFDGSVNFEEAKFKFTAYFDCTIFSSDSIFRFVSFGGAGNFKSARFEGELSFSSAKLCGEAEFSCVTFGGDTDFDSASFNRAAHFISATFCKDVDFRCAEFGGYAYFR